MHYLFALVLGIVISFIAAIPVGAVNMAVVQATLNKGRASAYRIGLGAVLIETLYCAIPLFGFGYLLEDNPTVLRIIYLTSIPLLIIFGVYTIINRKRTAIRGVRMQSNGNAHNEFLYGATLCGTNPMVFFFWTQISATLTGLGLLKQEFLSLFCFLVAVPAGTFLLYHVFVLIADKFQDNIGLRTRARINLVVGLIFLGLAAYLGISFLLEFGYL